jgi:alpha-beta hydrolase superfamily lysophospholipase
MAPPFVLVHGAWHAGACWRPLVEELEARGERVVAPDLPCEDPDATLDDYARAVVDAAAGFDEPVTVVGHSLAGLTVPLIPERRPVAGLVFIAAALPIPGEPASSGVPPESLSDGFPELLAALDPTVGWTREAAIAAFYHDVPEPLLSEAIDALRGQEFGPTVVPWPLAAYPNVPVRYLACDDDRTIDPAWQVRTAKERLGIDAEVIAGSHSPMLSRPAELADLLLG